MNWKKASAWLLLFVFTIQTMGSVLMIAGFYLHRDAIARNFCVNKAKPELKCCGRCHLNKQLKDEQNESDSKTENKSQYKTEVLSSRSFFAELPVWQVHQTSPYSEVKTEKIVEMPRSVFRPPDVPICG